MNELKLVIEQTGQSYTLKPNREYIIGSGSDCDISLPYVNVVANQHLKLSFEQFSQTWHAVDLGSGSGTFVDNQQIIDYPIQYQTRIALASGIFLVATPGGISASTILTPPPVYAQNPYQGRPSTQQQSVARNQSSSLLNLWQEIRNLWQLSVVTNQSSSLEVLTWKQYVEKQLKKYEGKFFAKTAANFSMITGFRNTPWIRKFGGYHPEQSGNGFEAFDGYIIPDFKESAQTIAVKIEERLGETRGYENTDCCVVMLTDAHIADSATQSFLGVELCPIQRGVMGRFDYRRFCIVSYNRVRTYLLVENYGSDLFVSWITRFEPEPTPLVPIYG